MTESLYEIGVRHGTDKAGERQLLRHYEPFVAQHRTDDLVVVEIGVLGGASLRMWQEYFPLGTVWGLDVDPAAREHEDDRIEVRIGAQADADFLDSVLDEAGSPDVVIDDGSHFARDQVGTLMHLWPHLAPGGLYIVEDTHTSYMPAYNMRWREPGSTIEILKGVVDDVHDHWHDRPVTFRDCAMVAFFSEACVMRKRQQPR
jgi:hypothetical protein